MTSVPPTSSLTSAITDQRTHPTAALVSTTGGKHPTAALIDIILDAVKAFGLNAETIADVELLLQRGNIFEIAMLASKEFSDLHEALLSFDDVAQRAARHVSLKPWLDAIEADKAAHAEIFAAVTE